MFSYSIAIRTLASNPPILKKELESIVRQTVQPEKVIIYIAKGYERPCFTIGREEYVWVKKGMVAQRALDYDEIQSNVILMLDDDVELAEDSAEKMLRALEKSHADCVAADTFKNQEMSFKEKFLAFITNGVIGRKDDGGAFKQLRNGSFSYNHSPSREVCLTETFAGPCWMVKKETLNKIHIEDELWLDNLGFSYGDDAVESYKLFLNGYKCVVLYDSGVNNLDARTSSGEYNKTIRKFYTRSFGMFTTWWRMIYSSRDNQCLSLIAFSLKAFWQLILHFIFGLMKLDMMIPYNYLKGIKDGWVYVCSDEFKSLPPYILNRK